MEGRPMSPELKAALERAEATRASKAKADTPPQTLEEMFGKEKAARMRREAEIKALQDGLKD